MAGRGDTHVLEPMEVARQDPWVEEERNRDLAVGETGQAVGKTRVPSLWERTGWGWWWRCEVGVVAEALPGSGCG